ncbi:VOC family protein [Paenibacillus azoreducens]|uniref:VOC family protein n=1 Tax=Paenibacillus azoreducens TaxID=116718 RepID=A0A920CT79_9BACL|nr:VOC family protein [Paenibacillus azoreducens]GIO48178.1 VOC family protein [Paenibacillus azoreducens]
MSLKIAPYINLDGECAEAVAFYEKVLGAKNLGIQRFGDMPGNSHPMPEEAKNRVLHAALEFDGQRLMFSDTFPGNPFQLGDQLSIAINTKDLERLKSIYHALAEGGQVKMELQETFWSPLYGMVRDRFGITWQLSGEASQE